MFYTCTMDSYHLTVTFSSRVLSEMADHKYLAEFLASLESDRAMT